MTQIPATNPLDAVARPNVGNRFSAMSSEDFVRIIFTELANQDPLAPNDSNALLQQLSSLRSIESDIQLIDQLKSLVTENQLAAGSSLIGKFVTGLTATNDRVSGNVRSVRPVTSDDPNPCYESSRRSRATERGQPLQRYVV